MKRSILFLLLCTFFLGVQAQKNGAQFWKDKQVNQVQVLDQSKVQTFASDFRLVELDKEQLAPQLLNANKTNKQISVPMPDGSQQSLSLQLDRVMAPGLAARYPGIQTYRILADGKNVYGGRAGWTYIGFHATIRTSQGTVYIDPYIVGEDDYYVSYYVNDNIKQDEWNGFECHTNHESSPLDLETLFPAEDHLDALDKTVMGTPVVQRTYRLAMACTGEFSNYYDGPDNVATVEESMAGIVTIVNRVNELWTQEVAVRVELIENNDQLIFLNPSTDPYVNQTDEMLNDNPTVLDLNVGNDAYDIGHVISTGPAAGQGVAALGGACGSSQKGRATSTKNNPMGDPFVVAILCHEMGHQLNATHTMSGCQNVTPETAYEPGGGSTIMSYAGICPNGYNTDTNTDPYYNVSSLEQMRHFTTVGNGASCGTTQDFNNTNPDVTLDYTDGFYIPISTPFELEGSATDMEGDELTYNWEQHNNTVGYPYSDSDQGPYPGSPVGNSPIFRSVEPTNEPMRIFPKMSTIVNNTSFDDEVLPTYSRNLTFRLTARDNHAESGGVGSAELSFQATADAGPFRVMSPNAGGETWNVGDYQEVTWDVANTDAAPVNCERVDIFLSTDGGYTYPITLAEGTPNTGSAFVTVPDAVGSNLRIKVKASNSIFFDISNANFSIEAATTPAYTLVQTPLYQSICTPNNASIDINTAAILDYSETISFEVTSTLPAGVTASFASASVQAGDNTSLDLDFNNTMYHGTLDVEITATSTDGSTTTRNFTVKVTNNDFSDLTLNSPANATQGIVLTADFEWADIPNADAYDIQIAYSPDFEADLFEEASGLTTTSFTPQGLFEGNSLLFWRIRPHNDCGAGPWTQPYTFHTEVVSCDNSTSEDTPLVIPGTGPLPTIVSSIFIEQSGAISDVNIAALSVSYSPLQNFKIHLVSPAGTRATLYNGTCFSTNLIFAGFDDEAPSTLACPPTGGIVYQPYEPLSIFNGEDTEGEWQLEVQVTQTGNGSGSVADWEIEFCSSTAVQGPSLVNNEALRVPPLMSNPITEDLLSVSDPDQNPLELEYTIVSTPEHGTLYFLDQELTVGSTFRQASINAYNVRYENTNGAATTDAFTFVVQDGTGGFLPVEQFDIIIDEDATVGTNEIIEAESFRLFPNPARNFVTLEWSEATSQELPMFIYNLQGQLVKQQALATGTIQEKVNVEELAAGVYIIQVANETLRLVIQ